MPGGIDAQILRLVYDPRTVLEGDDLDRMAVVVRIRKIAGNVGNFRSGARPEDISTDRSDVRIQPQDEFAPRIDPLPRNCRDQPQKNRFVFEQSAEAAIFHFGDKLIVARQAGGLARRRQIVPCFARLPCLGKAFVDRRSGKPGESLEKRHAQASASCFAEVVERPFADAGPEHRVGMFDYGSEQMFEGTRFGTFRVGGDFAACG